MSLFELLDKIDSSTERLNVLGQLLQDNYRSASSPVEKRILSNTQIGLNMIGLLSIVVFFIFLVKRGKK